MSRNDATSPCAVARCSAGIDRCAPVNASTSKAKTAIALRDPALVSFHFEPGHAAEVLDVRGDDRHAIGERRRGNPQIVAADQLSVSLQMPKHPTILPGHILVGRQNIKGAEKPLPDRTLRH